MEWETAHSFEIYIFDESKTTNYNNLSQAVAFNKTQLGTLTTSYTSEVESTIYVKVVLKSDTETDYKLTLEGKAANEFHTKFIQIPYTTVITEDNVTMAPFHLSYSQKVQIKMTGTNLPLYLFEEFDDYLDTSLAQAVSSEGLIEETLPAGYWVAVVINPGKRYTIQELIFKISAFCPANYVWNTG